MFSKKKPKPNDDVDSSIRILKINDKNFVVGLEWELIKAQRTIMKEVKRIGKSRNLDVVAIREAEAIQAGFAPKTKHKLRGYYSLVVALASLMQGTCIAVIPLGVNKQGVEEFTLLGRTEKGTIHPDSDKIHSHDEMAQCVIDLRQQLIGSKQGISVPVYGDPNAGVFITDVLDLESILLAGNIRKEFRLKPLQWGMTKNQLYGFAATLLMLGVAVFFILQYLNEQEIIKQEAALQLVRQQDEINKNARYKAVLDKLSHPWIKTSSIPVFISGCEDGLKKLNISIKGYQLAMMKCTQDGISANYNRPDNSSVTAEGFVQSVRELYGTDPDVSITQTSMSVFHLPHSLQGNGDDPFQNMGQQLLKVISLFQSVNIPAALMPVSIKDIEKNEFGEDLPLQDWEEYTFDVKTDYPPQLIFKDNEFTGVRVNSIIYEFGQDNGSVSYKITGSVYGKRIFK